MGFPGVVPEHVPGTLGEHAMFPVPCSLFPVPLRLTCSLFPVPCSHNTPLREHVFRVPCSLSPYGKTHRWINRWIGIDIQIDVETISHHTTCFVDVYPGPFLITSVTIWDHKSWSFSAMGFPVRTKALVREQGTRNTCSLKCGIVGTGNREQISRAKQHAPEGCRRLNFAA